MEFEDTLQLIRSAREGSDPALEELFRRYLPRVRQIVALRLGCRRADLATREDLVQESLLHVFENLDRFEERSGGSFRNWIATCVANTIRNVQRDARAQKRGGGRVRRFADILDEDLSAAIFPGDAPTPSAIHRGVELLERIEAALLALGDRDRELIVLRRLCEMTYAEIAAQRGESEMAVRKAFNRAMRRLESAIEGSDL